MNRYDRNLQIIYIGIVMSTLIYAVVAWVTTHAIAPGRTLTDELHNPITIALYAVAGGTLLAAIVIRARKLLIVRWAMLEAACICGLVAAIGASASRRGRWRWLDSSAFIRECVWPHGDRRGGMTDCQRCSSHRPE